MERVVVLANPGFRVKLDPQAPFDRAGFDEEALKWKPGGAMVAHMEYAVVDGVMHIFPWSPDHAHLTAFIGARPEQVSSTGFIGVSFQNGKVNHREMCDFTNWPFPDISRSKSEEYRKKSLHPNWAPTLSSASV